MARKRWMLTNQEQDVYVDRFTLRPEHVGGAAAGYSVTKRTLRSGLSQGVDVVEIHNGRLRLVVVPTRGMSIWRAGCGAVQLGWSSPVRGPVHPAFVNLWEPSGIGWLGGFDELLVRCGLESNGAPEFDSTGRLVAPLHGRIANLPAHQVELDVDGDSGEITLTGVVDEARLFGNKLRMVSTITTTVDQPRFRIVDEISSLSAEPSELELLYHVNFGPPLLGPGAKVVVPAAKVAPRDAVAAADLDTWDTYGPQTPGAPEAVFFFDLMADAEGRTRALLRGSAGDQGVSLVFFKNELPCFTLWKNRQAEADGYVTGLEPGINFPNRKSFEKQQGRVAVLRTGQSRRFQIDVEVHEDAASVAAAEREIAVLAKGVAPRLCPQGEPSWSPG